MPHYGVEMRMGISMAYITISKSPITYPKFSKADILVIMTKRNIDIPKTYINKNTLVINAITLNNLPRERNLPKQSFNMMVLGIIIKELNKSENIISKEKILESINNFLSDKPDITKNRVAFEVGYDLDESLYKKTIDNIRADKYNPVVDSDSQKTHIKYPDVCKSCGFCLIKCPVNALSWDNEKYNFLSKPIPKVDIKKCTGCGLCEQICPDAAIKVNKKK